MKRRDAIPAIALAALSALDLSGAGAANAAGLKVLFFLDPECPVTNAYMSEIKKIYAAYAPESVAFEAIFPMQTIQDGDIRAFLKKYGAQFPGVRDAGLQKSKRYGAKVMPEAVLLNAQGIVVYRGAIDNWYYALGKSRPKATEFYLRNAIDATLAGDVVAVARTEAFGCLINL